MQTLVTGASGYVGAALAPRLSHDGHAVRGFARSKARVDATGAAFDELVLRDASTGTGLAQALERGARKAARRRRGRLLPDPLDGGPGSRLRRRRVATGGALRGGRREG